MKKLAYLMAGLGLMLSQLGSVPAMAGITISVDPYFSKIPQGGTVTVNIVASGLSTGGAGGGQEVISAFDLLLGFDPTKLSWSSTTFGSSLGPQFITDSDDLNSAELAAVNYLGPFTAAVDFSELSLLCAFSDGDLPGCTYAPPLFPYLSSIQGDSITLAKIAFTALPGFLDGEVTPLGLIDNRDLTPPGSGPFDVKGSVPTPLDTTLVDGLVEVPEPGTLMLLLSAGLAGLGRSAVRRRQ